MKWIRFACRGRQGFGTIEGTQLRCHSGAIMLAAV